MADYKEPARELARLFPSSPELCYTPRPQIIRRNSPRCSGRSLRGAGRSRLRGNVQEIGKVLPAIFKGHMRRANPPLVEILAPLWPRVAGRSIAARSLPVAFEAGTLTVATRSPSWAAQLRRLAEEIRAAVNSFLGGPLVKNVRIRLSAGASAAWGPPEGAIRGFNQTPPSSAPGPLDAGKLQFLDGEARLDPEIARIVERSYAKYFSRGASRR